MIKELITCGCGNHFYYLGEGLIKQKDEMISSITCMRFYYHAGMKETRSITSTGRNHLIEEKILLATGRKINDVSQRPKRLKSFMKPSAR